jgi:hypothetical protein
MHERPLVRSEGVPKMCYKGNQKELLLEAVENSLLEAIMDCHHHNCL